MYFFINKFSLSYLFSFNDIIIIIIIYLLALFNDYSFFSARTKNKPQNRYAELIIQCRPTFTIAIKGKGVQP